MKTSTILASLVAALLVSGCKSNDPEPPKIVQVPVAKAPEAKAAKDVARPVDGRIEIHATREGFEPSKIEVPGGEPLTLVFVRDIEKTCMDGVVFPDLGIEKELPVGEKVEIALTPEAGGTIRFQCPMGMGKSTIVALPKS